jgi:hypothetical protein
MPTSAAATVIERGEMRSFQPFIAVCFPVILKGAPVSRVNAFEV